MNKKIKLTIKITTMRNATILFGMVFILLFSSFFIFQAQAKIFEKRIDLQNTYTNILSDQPLSTTYIAIFSSRITNDNISSNANIKYSKLDLDDSIKSSDIKDGSINIDKLDSKVKKMINQVGIINNNSITNSKLASNAVTTDKIQDGTIVGGDLAGDIDITTTGTFTAPSFIGDLFGNVVGNMFGNFTGDLTGNVVGDVVGDLTGDVNGNVTGNVIGDVSGNLTGDVVGNVTGDVVGNVTGNLTGNADTVTNGVYTTGSYADPAWITSLDASKITGIINATIADGSITNSKLAPDAVTSDKIQDDTITGDDLEHNFVMHAGTTFTAPTFIGDLTGNVTGNVTGDVVGNVTGNLTGNADTVTNGVYTTGSYADPAWITSLDGSKITGVINATVADNSITNAKLSDDAVTTDKIQDGTIVGGDLTGDIDITTTGTFTAPSFIGDLFGNVVGNMFGNFTGDLTGNVVGDVVGDLTGDVNGNVTGNVIGDVSGNLTGDVVGNVTGNLTGNADTVTNGVYTTGSYADPAWITSLAGSKITGTVALADNVIDGAITNSKLASNAVTTDKIQDGTIVGGDLAGDISVATTGTFTAPTFVGNLTGNVTGDLAGDVTGNVMGDLTGNVTGDVTGDLIGDVTGDVIGDVTGNLTGNVTGDVTGNLTGNADSATTVADNAITNAKLSDDAVTTDKIQNGTIVGGDLAGDIDITTTGDVQTNQLNATTITDGITTLTGGNFSTTSHTQTFSAGNDATDSDIYITNTGSGRANLHVEGDVTGGSLGTTGSRWSTIYANSLNFLSGLTNADNTSGSDSTINLGTAGADSAEIHIGNSNANISITDNNWSIADTGAADFVSIGASAPGTANFSTLITSGLATLNSLTIDNGLTVNGTATFGDKATINANGIDVTGNSDFRNNIDLNNNDIDNIGNLTASGTITGDFDSTGSMDMNNNDINNVDNINASGTISGTINASGGHNNNITVKGSDGNDCTINVDDGIITGTTCP